MFRDSKTNQQFLETQDNAYLMQQYKCALTIPMVTPAVFESLSRAYAPVLLKCKATRCARTPSEGHQIGQSHLIIADQYLTSFIENHNEFIEIGPNPANFVRRATGKINPHGCTLRSGRDQARYIIAAQSNEIRNYRPSSRQILAIQDNGISHQQLHRDVQSLASGISTETFCTRGWENCNARSPIAISNHSLYDISFRSLAEGFHHHNTLLLRAYIHFPVEALDVQSWTNHELGYSFNTVKHEGEEHIRFFWIGDPAFAYSHKKSVWMKYLTTSGFDTPFGFSIIIEKTRRMGSQFELNISRTTAPDRLVARIPSAFTDLIRLPNFRVLASKGFCKRNFTEDPDNYIITDAYKIRKLLEFIDARTASGCTLETVKAYARTLISEIRLGGKVAEHRWNCSTIEFSDICISVYILSIYKRKLHGEIITSCMTHMDEIARTWGWVDKISAFFKEHQSDLPFGKKVHNHKINHVIAEDTTNIFHRVSVSFFDQHSSEDSIHEHGYDQTVFFDYSPAPLPEDDIVPAAPEPEVESAVASLVPTWAAELGFTTNCSNPSVGPDYMAEEQHDILIAECKQGAQKTDIRGLKICLEDAAKVLESKKPDHLFLENMFLLTGVPGAAKTADVINKIIPAATATGSPVLVLCPTAALANKYNPDLGNRGTALTIHSGLRALAKPGAKFSLVIVEEIFTLPVAYFNFIASYGHTLGIGDPNQIQHVDFSGLWANTMMMSHIAPSIPSFHKSKTYRMPQDMLALPIIKNAYPGIESHSKKQQSIQHVRPNFQQPNATTIVFTQDLKHQCEQVLKENAFTAHECQGQTFPSVILHYGGTMGEFRLLQQSRNHLITALTRHTNMLYIRDNSPENVLTTFMNESSVFTHIAEEHNIEPGVLDVMEGGRPVAVEAEITVEPTVFVRAKTTSYTTAELIQRYHPLPPMREEVAVSKNDLPNPGGAKGVLRLNALGVEELSESKPKKIHRFPVPQNVKVTKATYRLDLARTNLERLAHCTKNMKGHIAKKTGHRLAELVIDEFDWELPEQMKATCFLDAVEKMQARGQDLTNLTDSTNWTDHHANLVKSFLKTQQKPSGLKDPLEADKAGQGISAWTKTLNILMAPYVRMIEHVMINQTKGRVFVTSQKDDVSTMAMLEQDHIPGETYLCNDWTQFDSNQNDVSRYQYTELLKKVGCPDKLLHYWNLQSKSRKVACDSLTLQVVEKLDSGAPNTFSKNTALNAGVALDTTTNAEKMYFKGDDMFARGRDIRFDLEKMKKYGRDCGYRFKPEYGVSAEYISFIINQQGVAYDLVRIASKVLSRCYDNFDDYQHYQQAIRGSIGSIDQEALSNMCKVNALHYDGSTRTESTFDQIASFLTQFAHGKIPFSDTIQCEHIHLRVEGPRSDTQIPVKISKRSAALGAVLSLLD
uniref:Non-structural polyprotein n=1 Tax=Crocidura lasiura astrovirus TaxID=3139461 RepID=A0AB38ZJL2_9VIRU